MKQYLFFLLCGAMLLLVTGCDYDVDEPAAPAPTVQNTPAPTEPVPAPCAQQAVADFLAQIPSLHGQIPLAYSSAGPGAHLAEGQFSLGWAQVDGEWQEQTTFDVPAFYFRHDRYADTGLPAAGHGFFDREGNPITDVPWILGDHFATDYRLWHIDESGVPIIALYYGGNVFEDTGNIGTRGRLFLYTDGAFTYFPAVRDPLIENFNFFGHTAWSQFFTCQAGRLLRTDRGIGGGYFIWLEEVTFTQAPQATFTPLGLFTYHYQTSWTNLLSNEGHLIPDVSDTYLFNLHLNNYLYLRLAQTLGIELTLVYPV